MHPTPLPVRPRRVRLLAGASLLALTATLSAQTIITDLVAVADTYIRDDSETRGTMEFLDLRDNGSSIDFVGYIRFDLPNDVGTIIDASVSFQTVAGSRNDSATTGRFALFGLLDTAGTTPQNWIESGTGALNTLTIGSESRATLDGVVSLDGGINDTVETLSAGIFTVTGPALVAFLQGRADANGLATFIADFPTSTSDRGFGLASRENTSGAQLPTLQIEYIAIPEPRMASLFLGLAGLGAVVALRRRRA